MKNKFKTIIRVFGYVLIIHIVVAFILVYRFMNPVGIRSDRIPEDYNLNYETVSFDSRDGVDLRGWYMQSFKEEAPTVILMHGYPADKADMLPEAEFLVREFNVFMFDFRSLGESGGSHSTLGAKEVNDLHGAIDYLIKEKETENFFLWGFSMGAGVALQVTPEREEVIAVISDSSFADMDQVIDEMFPFPIVSSTVRPFINFWTRALADVDIRKTSPKKAAARIEVPVYLIHTKNDPVVPFEHGKVLKDAMSENPGLEVGFVDLDYHGAASGQLRNKLYDFLIENSL